MLKKTHDNSSGNSINNKSNKQINTLLLSNDKNNSINNKNNKKIRKRNNKSLINIINDNKNSLYGRFAITVAGIDKSKVKNCAGISENNISCGSSKKYK